MADVTVVDLKDRLRERIEEELELGRQLGLPGVRVRPLSGTEVADQLTPKG